MDLNWSLPDWSRVLGAPGISGLLRTQHEDFRVEELPLVKPDGEGNHLWLEIEKRGANTDWVARQLASQAGVPGRDVGYAGMKDRHGVTSQWFSIGLQEARDTDWDQWQLPDAVILQAHRHHRKLKRGALRGNRFRIVARQLEGCRDGLEERLQQVAKLGVPNYFGPQRFGHGGLNVARGAHWLEHGGRIPRHKKSIYLSAVRSFLFNAVVSRRVGLGNWNQILDGEIASLDGSRSGFACRMPDPELERRCDEFDIHPSGPLPGSGGRQPERDAAEIENEVLKPLGALIAGLEKAGLKSARRSLRLVPGAMSWQCSDSELALKFDLPPGAYATAVLRELVSVGPVSISGNT
ncbi:MAG: tRNA pseudouridine(13) synthase TruD [Gammaproteobacteria bacterium]|nr:tRNA pseudouridine(13) synthase TruD [Gammaproteobacteria bacterium]